jgi:hypothetical protein
LQHLASPPKLAAIREPRREPRREPSPEYGQHSEQILLELRYYVIRFRK